jgi:hypothetical protein
MTILCVVQELFLPTSGYLNFKRRLHSVFKYVPRYAAIRGPCQFSNARLIPVQFAVRTSRVTSTSPFTHRLRNQINGLSSGTKMCLSAVIFNI